MSETRFDIASDRFDMLLVRTRHDAFSDDGLAIDRLSRIHWRMRRSCSVQEYANG